MQFDDEPSSNTSSENTMVLCHNALKIFLFVCSVKTWLDFVSNVIVLQSSDHQQDAKTNIRFLFPFGAYPFLALSKKV